jgi:hypothetical protein
VSQALARAILGAQVAPNRGEIDAVPAPYRTTFIQSRALARKKGSQPVEPGEVVIPVPPISEEPT